jgi:hypothetical protein
MPMFALGPGRVETFVLFLCGGLVGPVARSAWIYSVLFPDRLAGWNFHVCFGV